MHVEKSLHAALMLNFIMLNLYVPPEMNVMYVKVEEGYAASQLPGRDPIYW